MIASIAPRMSLYPIFVTCSQKLQYEVNFGNCYFEGKAENSLAISFQCFWGSLRLKTWPGWGWRGCQWEPNTRQPDHKALPDDGQHDCNDIIQMIRLPTSHDNDKLTFLSIRERAESSPGPCCSGSRALPREVFRDFLREKHLMVNIRSHQGSEHIRGQELFKFSLRKYMLFPLYFVQIII